MKETTTTSATLNNRRIAKNTLMLYFRMILTMFVSLYTSRVILNTLGVEDYGIYNLVGGIVIILSILSSAMSNSTQRFLNYEMGKGNFDVLRKIFSMSINIHFIIGVIIFLLLETVGLWFLETKLIIPDNRLYAAKTVFHLSLLSLLITIITTPYTAIIIAYERMNIFAYVSIIEVLLKLGIAYLLVVIPGDKLQIYGILLFIVTLIVRFIYFLYCRKQFSASHYFYYWDKESFISLFRYSSWSMVGDLANMLKNQGVNIILNIFFGTVVNAARAISSQVEAALASFVWNFQIAMRPQIIKSYASNDNRYMLSLIFSGAKYSSFLLICLSLPVFLEAEQILRLWLNIVPDHTVNFLRLTLLATLVDTLSSTFKSAIEATGKLKVYQTIVSIILVSVLPISYMCFSWNYPPESTFVILNIIFCILLFAKILIVKKYITLRVYDYFRDVVFRVVVVTISSAFIPYLIRIKIPEESLFRLLIVFIASIISVLVSTYFLGMNNKEKIKATHEIKKYINAYKRKK